MWLRGGRPTRSAGTTLSGRALPRLPSEIALDRGGVGSIEIASPLGEGPAHFTINASKPLMVEAFAGTQESGAIVLPVDQFIDDYRPGVPPWFSGYLMVTRAAATPVTLDGAPVPDAVFSPAGGGFEVSMIGLKRCDGFPSECGHAVLGAKIGMTITASGGLDNIAYVAGGGLRCINKTAGCR